MATITKRTDSKGNIIYRAQIRINGFPQQSETFEDEQNAKLWAKQVEEQFRMSKTFTSKNPIKRYLFKDVAEKYCKEHLSLIKDGIHRKTQVNFWVEKFEDKFIDEITSENIENILMEMSKTVSQKTRKIYSEKTVTRYMSALSHIFTMAMKEYRIISHHPVMNISRPGRKRTRIGVLQDKNVIDWIPFSIRTPPEDEEILVLFEDRFIQTCFWSPFNKPDNDESWNCEDHKGCLIESEAIFWTKIPELPDYEWVD